MNDVKDPTAQLAELIKDIRIAMLTTRDAEGALRSRPMATQHAAFDGELWFFTRARDGKADEILHDHRVGLSYAAPDRQRYVSVTGRAELSRDEAKMRELWNPFYRAWFPEGLNDPELALLKVVPDKAEFWDSPSGAVVHLVGFVKSVLTGRSPSVGRSEKLDLDPRLH